jgi:Tfp pilus assembly protein PilW
MITRPRSDEGGYTLVEFAVAMGVFLLFISMAAPFMFSQLQGALETEERADLQQNARTALRTMVRELRQAKQLYQTIDNPSGNSRVSLAVDFNSDVVITGCNASPPDVPEMITYYLDGMNLMRGCKIGNAVPLAAHVSSVEYDYFGSNLALDTTPKDGVVTENEIDRNGNGLEPPELVNVTRILITLTAEDDDGDTQTYQQQAFLRNGVVA